MAKDRSLNVDETAAYLKEAGSAGSTTFALARLRYTGRGPAFFKKDGRIFYRQRDLDTFIAAGSSRRLPKPRRPVVAPEVTEAVRLAEQAAHAARQAAHDAIAAAQEASARAAAARRAARAVVVHP